LNLSFLLSRSSSAGLVSGHPDVDRAGSLPTRPPVSAGLMRRSTCFPEGRPPARALGGVLGNTEIAFPHAFPAALPRPAFVIAATPLRKSHPAWRDGSPPR